MELNLKINNKNYKLEMATKDEKYQITIGSESYGVECTSLCPGIIELNVDGERHVIHYVWHKNLLYLHHNGIQYKVEELEQKRGKAHFTDNILVAPMTGAIVKLNNQKGDIVDSGKTIMIVEAMKMENELKAPYKAKIKKLHGKVGDQVEGGTPLIELDPVGAKP